jgi:hypothetical protein
MIKQTIDFILDSIQKIENCIAGISVRDFKRSSPRSDLGEEIVYKKRR